MGGRGRGEREIKLAVLFSVNLGGCFFLCRPSLSFGGLLPLNFSKEKGGWQEGHHLGLTLSSIPKAFHLSVLPSLC